MIDDAVVAGNEAFRLLNGILFLSPNCGGRLNTRVYFFPTRDPSIPLAPEMQQLLEEIRDWNSQMFDPK